MPVTVTKVLTSIFGSRNERLLKRYHRIVDEINEMEPKISAMTDPELRARTPKSVFHFDVQGSVAKSTHAGLPWLRYIRRQTSGRVHFWPFDGCDIPPGRSVVAEVYPSLWSRMFPRRGRDTDQQDAYSVAAWMRRADHDGTLTNYLNPTLAPAERATAQIEGWILGVP